MPSRSILPSLFITGLLLAGCVTPPTASQPVRVGVIGGMLRSGLWPELARQFERERGFRVEATLSGNRELLAEGFRAGKADWISLHAGAVASNLVAEGYARDMRVWTRNEFVIIGPATDPAGIRGLRDGAGALERIARKEAPLVNYQNSGPRDVSAALWQKAGIRPRGKWLLECDCEKSEEVLEFARTNRAYVVLGRLPAIPEGLEILVSRDPEMHRSFVALSADPKRFPQANVKAARALTDYLLSAEAQRFLVAFGTNVPPGVPLFGPVKRF